MARQAKSMTSLKSKKKPTTAKLPRAFDTKYTGEEPVFFGWEDWPISKFMTERRRVGQYYAYHHTAKDLVKNVALWMKDNGYTKEQIKSFRESNLRMLSLVVGAYASARINGMPSVHPGQKEWLATQDGIKSLRPVDDFLHEEIDKFLNGPYRAELFKKDDDDEAPKKPSPIDLLREKINKTILTDLDEWYEDQFANTKNFEKFDIFASLQKHMIPANGCPHIIRYLKDIHTEIAGSLDKKNEPQLAEGYSHIPLTHRRKIVKILEEMIADTESHQQVKKAVRAPRVKKPQAATKQVARMKYEKENQEFKIASINPLTIVGSQVLYAFNTKTRTLFEYVASGPKGFEVKGTTLQGFDLEKSRQVRLRKPEDMLPIVLKKTKAQIGKAWDTLKTKTSVPNGRFNEQIVLLRVV